METLEVDGMNDSLLRIQILQILLMKYYGKIKRISWKFIIQFIIIV